MNSAARIFFINVFFLFAAQGMAQSLSEKSYNNEACDKFIRIINNQCNATCAANLLGNDFDMTGINDTNFDSCKDECLRVKLAFIFLTAKL